MKQLLEGGDISMKQLLASVLLIGLLFTGCGLSEEGKEAKALIDVLPETYTYSEELDKAMEEAYAAYHALPEKEQKNVDVTKLDHLGGEQLSYRAEKNQYNDCRTFKE